MSNGARTVVLFEDEAVAGLLPLALTRPTFELRCGALTLRERLELSAAGLPRLALVRPHLVPLLRRTVPELVPSTGMLAAGPILWINARACLSTAMIDQLLAQPATPPRAHWVDGAPAAAWTPALVSIPERAQLVASLAALPQAPTPEGIRLARHPWDLVLANGAMICEDFRALGQHRAVVRRVFGVVFEPGHPAAAWLSGDGYGPRSGAAVYPGVHLLEESHIRFGPGATVKPGVVLDAEEGPILIGAGAKLAPNVVVQGPAYIGPGCTVNPGAKLREGTSLGALCKVGGEVEESILLDLSNKQHDGFLGHACLGSWVNLGAATDASDLKNNYGTVRVDLGGGDLDTGQRFVGPTIGDHAKTGINTMLTTGTVVGVCANVFGGGFPPRFVPSFAWGGPQGFVEHRLEAAQSTARTVMGRRRALWLAEHEQLLAHAHAATAGHRAALRAS
jgi:UDP-N-acetylglucosamine diphosphorylase/glucosamine-1-phosphate N-acetyltransferase